MERRRLAIVLLALGAAACAAVPAAGARTAGVAIRDIDFSRHRVVIHRGDSVRWRFVDPHVSHNVTSRGTHRFRSSPTLLAGTHTVRFSRAGTYRYVCTIHPNMKGTVVVRP